MACPRCGKNAVTMYGPYHNKILPYIMACSKVDGGCGFYTETSERFPKTWQGQPIKITRFITGRAK